MNGTGEAPGRERKRMASITPTDADARAISWRGLTLLLLTLTYFFSYMDRQILAILLELIKADLRLDDTQLGLLTGFAFALFYAVLGIPVARLADRRNRRDIVAVSLAIWSVMTAACGLAGNFTHLLLARIGVGIGEAGSSPPSHSIIADLYPPERRAGAMAIYSLGVVLGAGVGTFLGGTVAHFYGWRVAMFVIGLPGVLLALLVRALVVEPRRGLADGATAEAHGAMPSLGEGFAAMWRNRAALYLVVGVTVTSLVGYSLTGWGPSYMQRSLGMSMLSISLYVAPLGTVIAAASALLGGKVADRWAARRGLHVQSWVVAVMKTAALPFAMLFYAVDNVALALTFYFVSLLFANSYLGPSFALIQGLAPVRLRALWAAITLLVINLLGLGLGPTMVGVLSDMYRPWAGAESLRYAMLSVYALTPVAILAYWRAGVHLRRAG
jgi:MFS family permease